MTGTLVRILHGILSKTFHAFSQFQYYTLMHLDKISSESNVSSLFFLQGPAGTRKLSKEEKEKLRRLEQERKLREAEEAR